MYIKSILPSLPLNPVFAVLDYSDHRSISKAPKLLLVAEMLKFC